MPTGRVADSDVVSHLESATPEGRKAIEALLAGGCTWKAGLSNRATKQLVTPEGLSAGCVNRVGSVWVNQRTRNLVTHLTPTRSDYANGDVTFLVNAPNRDYVRTHSSRKQPPSPFCSTCGMDLDDCQC